MIDSGACEQTTLAWDGISTSPASRMMAVLAALTESQKVSATGMGDLTKIDINFLTQGEMTVNSSIDQDWDTFSKLTVNIELSKATADEANLLYYMIAKNAFSGMIKKLHINVKTSLTKADGIVFPKSTKWPLTKTSSLLKKMNTKIENNLMSNEDC